MRSRLLAALLLSAAAPAAAQVRVGIVEGNVGRGAGIPAVGMEVRREFSPTSLSLMPLSPALSPNLSAPAVSPDLSAVILPVLNNSAEAAVQMPSSLPRAVLHAASKADELRAEASRAIADWRASRSVPSAAQPAPPADPAVAALSAVNPSVELDALFDGFLPTSRDVLSRVESLGLEHAVLARAISDSQTPAEAAARLSAMGLLGPKETALAPSDEAGFRLLLGRLWRKTASSVPAAFKVDDSFGVSALKVERAGVTYFVHAVAHGKLGAPRRSAVLATVRRIAAAGHALYSEQNLPVHYGYKTGLETLDHAAESGGPAAVVPAAPAYTRATLLLKRAIDWAVTSGALLATLVWAIAFPVPPYVWALLPVIGAFTWHVLSGGLPMMRWRDRLKAAAARLQGRADIAEMHADEAANFYTAKPDLEILRGLELPQPLGAEADDPFSNRSRAIAAAVAAGAAVSGASAVHLVVGHLHAHEVAWRLANGPQSISKTNA